MRVTPEPKNIRDGFQDFLHRKGKCAGSKLEKKLLREMTRLEKSRLANKKLILELKKYELNKSKITETQRIKYNIKHPAFKDIDFTEHSKQWLTWPKAVEFAASQGNGTILQSAREASAFKIAAIGKHNADMLQAIRIQATRTVALYFKVGDKFYAAIDDTINPEQNIVIAHAQPGFKSHSKTGKYLLPITDALVKGALLRAEKSGRIVEINTTNVLKLATKAVNGKSDFGQNDWNKAILLDVAEPYAQMLSQRGYDIGCVWSLTPENLKDRIVDGKYVEVRPVGLGYGFGNIAAGLYYGKGGRACGVRHVHEFSIRNKGNVFKLVKKVFEFNDKEKERELRMKSLIKNKKVSHTNIDKLKNILKWAKYAAKNSLRVKGICTYDNDFFSQKYLAFLIKSNYLVFNKDYGKKKKIKKSLPAFEKGLKKITNQYDTALWYYKGQGRIMTEDVLKKAFKISSDKILNKFKITKKILGLQKENKYFVHADWWGTYFLKMAALVGKTFHEKTFRTEDLYNLPEFIKKEKPKGCVLSYITSDKKCPIYDIDLAPIMDLFHHDGLDYFKLLFVSKTDTKKTVEWVLAYSK